MYVTSLDFNKVLERFYQQTKYDQMLLFVSSFDDRDRYILNGIIENARRIDRILGDRICFFYFVKDRFDDMNDAITRWVREIPDYEPLYGAGVQITMDTADDICRHFRIHRLQLPAFILVDKSRGAAPEIMSVRNYHDLERFLSPLNILNAYIDDRNMLISDYVQRRSRGAVSQEAVDRPDLEVRGCDPSVVYPARELEFTRREAIRRLNDALNVRDASGFVDLVDTPTTYSEAVIGVWRKVSGDHERAVFDRLDAIHRAVIEGDFDVFISCKSQDYDSATELYDFLVDNGFKPFLADRSILEIGIDRYTALIGEVIDICRFMIVYASDADYLRTPYVAAEWEAFINDINSGLKPDGKLLTILSPDIKPGDLPLWLRSKQSLTIDNYKDQLLNYLRPDNTGWRSIFRRRSIR